ncbi:transporter substrate-binding domain-containing protein [Bacteriovoracales bacterium]|nr:transporter substrate-binding domain-containing protein [Bacteriovoracales bacterium]
MRYILFLFAFSFSAYAEKTITLATLAGYAPYTFKYTKKVDGVKAGENITPGKDTRSLQGIAWDIVRESFHSQGYTIKLHVYPWARALKQMKQGKVDGLFPTTKTVARSKFFYFSKNATNSYSTCFYTKAKTQFKFLGLSSLKGKTVGVIRGFSYGNKFDTYKKNLKVRPSRGDRESFLMLEKNRIDVYVGYDIVADYFLKKTNQLGKFKRHAPIDFNYEFLATNLDNQKKIQKIKDFDKGVEVIKKNGAFQKILNKWGIDELKVNPALK